MSRPDLWLKYFFDDVALGIAAMTESIPFKIGQVIETENPVPHEWEEFNPEPDEDAQFLDRRKSGKICKRCRCYLNGDNIWRSTPKFEPTGQQGTLDCDLETVRNILRD